MKQNDAKQNRNLSAIPPMPPDADDARRRNHTRARRRLMSGRWHSDLEDHLAQHFDPIRQEAVGKPDMSTNVFKTVIQQLSVLYSRKPLITHPDAGEKNEKIEGLLEQLNNGYLWSKAKRNQRYVLALRDSFIRPYWDDEDQQIRFRLVTPDMIYAQAPANNPEKPDYLVEARLREYPKNSGDNAWTWDVYDIRKGREPSFVVLLAEETKAGVKTSDVTKEYFDTDFVGANYPFTYKDNTPFIPYILYHAEFSGELFDAFEAIEMVEGTYRISVYWTYYGHTLRDGSWRQKWSMDAVLRGTDANPNQNVNASFVATDISSVMQFRSTGSEKGSVGIFGEAGNPQLMAKSISDFEQRLGIHYGISSYDFQRTESAESGYAITLKRESVREHQRDFEENFRDGDLELLSKTAAILNNSQDGADYPELDYGIKYIGLPESTQEKILDLEEHEKLVILGQESKVDLRMRRNPDETEEEATEQLRKKNEQNQLLGLPLSIKTSGGNNV